MVRCLLAIVALVMMAECSTGVVETDMEAGSIPNIPDGVNLDVSSLYNLWTHALRNQPSSRTAFPEIRTLINPHPFQMMNLVPMDGPHPLYSKQYLTLRTQFLTDYMLQDKVTPDDPRMTQPGGLRATNMNGKELTFTKDSQGKISIGGMGVENTLVMDGGLVTYALEGLLFDHQQRVKEAWEELHKNTPRSGPFGKPLL